MGEVAAEALEAFRELQKKYMQLQQNMKMARTVVFLCSKYTR